MATALNVTLSRNSMSSSVLNRLRRDIIFRVYQPGEKITEQFVSEKYKISRSPVRSIMQQLEKEGMIIMLDNGCKEIIGFTKNDLLNLYDFRNYLEISAVKSFFTSDKRKYTPLLSLLENLESGKAPDFDCISYDIEFHRSIIKMSENRFLLSAYNSIAPTLYTLFTINVSLYEQQFHDEYDARHISLVKSLISDQLSDCILKFKEHHDYALDHALVAMDMIENNRYKDNTDSTN